MKCAKLLISARGAINFKGALDPAVIGGRRLLEVFCGIYVTDRLQNGVKSHWAEG